MIYFHSVGGNMGKAYACRRNEEILESLHPSDFFETPKSCVWELLRAAPNDFSRIKTILEPCCGKMAISNVLKEKGFEVTSRDLIYGNNFLTDDYSGEYYDAVVTNPPFSYWDEVVTKSREVADRVFVIGKPTFFASHTRTKSNFWRELKHVWVFDRQLDYQFPVSENGECGVGCLVSGWFEWEKGYQYSPTIDVIDMQKYCVLGSYEKYIREHNPEEYKKLFGGKDE